MTDKGYITNSYHVHVSEEIDAFDKLKFEGMFQQLSPGGAISYVEVPNMQDNLKAVIRVMQYIYDNIMYAELNTKSDYCQVCGYDGEIKIVEDDGKLVWECPNCGNRDQEKMNVARRTCGYIGTSSGTRVEPRRSATACCISNTAPGLSREGRLGICSLFRTVLRKTKATLSGLLCVRNSYRAKAQAALSAQPS